MDDSYIYGALLIASPITSAFSNRTAKAIGSTARERRVEKQPEPAAKPPVDPQTGKSQPLLRT
jgi:hypothetical protein